MVNTRRAFLAATCAATLSLSLWAQAAPKRAAAPAKKAAAAAATPAPVANAKPKLVVLIVADQFRADYLWRFASTYNAGLARMLKNGAVFTNATQDHFPTVTAIGHSVTMTGAIPAISGIVGNEWYDRTTGQIITSVSDDTVKPLGSSSDKTSSPHRLLVSTVGDQLKMDARTPSKVVGVSLKDRAAILPAGHMADGAYWFDAGSGNFVSSTYYFPALPAWVDAFNAKKVPNTYAGKVWSFLDTGKPISVLSSEPGRTLNEGIYNSGYGNELLEAFAIAALDGEKLGQGPGTDVLTVSFSSVDAVGHRKGPDSPEIRDLCLRTDKSIGALLDAIDKRVGLNNALVLFTADHGVVPVPEVNQARHMLGGRLGSVVKTTIESALNAKYGQARWIAANFDEVVYLDRTLIESKKLRLDEVQDTAAKALLATAHIERVFTSEALRKGQVALDPVAQRVAKGFNERRAGDLFVVFEGFYLSGSGGGTSHGMPFSYDAHVPLVFLGPAVKPGNYNANVAVYDIAPTLATILQIERPSGSFGRVLDEALASK